MSPDVACGDAAEQGVGQGVQGDVGIGMTVEAGIVRDLEIAQGHMVAVAEPVHVEAAGDPDLAGLAETKRGAAQILRRGDLQIVFAAGDQKHIEPGLFGNRGIVGEFLSLCAPMRRHQGIEAKALGSLGPPQAGPGHRRLDQSGRAPPLQGIVDGERRNGARVVGKSGDDPADQPAADERPGSVMDQHQIGRLIGQPFEAEAHRILAGRTADDRLAQTQAGGGDIVKRPIVRMDDGLHRIDRRVGGKGGQAVAQHGRPPRSRHCLGISPPKRLPRPAATTKATQRVIASVPDPTNCEGRLFAGTVRCKAAPLPRPLPTL